MGRPMTIKLDKDFKNHLSCRLTYFSSVLILFVFTRPTHLFARSKTHNLNHPFIFNHLHYNPEITVLTHFQELTF